ncbi:MAG: hypothetical protein JW874_11220 [Spirochaetales bacterium]|nr:hypothetical protein [Spirochaetales bacterium]
MKKVLFIIAVVSIPALIFANVYQVYAFYIYQQDVRVLEARQKEIFELNKEILSNIALLKSLDRLEDLATGKFGLVRLPDSRVLHVRLPDKKVSHD